MAKNQQELNAFFKRLDGVASTLHLDVADGKFVPSKSLWFPFRLSRKFKYNAHLMINNPKKWIDRHGHKVDVCIVSFEVVKNVPKFISHLKEKKKKVAFALKPETKVKELRPYLKDIDQILILTVHPGFYGAKYLKAPLRKIKQIQKINPKIKIYVDGGMHPTTVRDAKGADYIISGSFTSKSDNPRRAIRELRKALKSHR